jgi:hypothetical protein
MARRPVVVAVSAVLTVAVCAGGTALAIEPRFSAPVELFVGESPFRVAAADFNGDGKPDLATADHGARSASVMLGHGDGSFRKRVAYRTAALPEDVAAADVSGDGKLDLITASEGRRGIVSVLVNDGTGRFSLPRFYPTGATAPAVAAADVNRDGIIDILTANIGTRDLSVLLGQGGAQFGTALRVSGGDGAVDLDVADLNGDGKLDVALATALRGYAVVIRLGNGDGTFGPKKKYAAGLDPDGVTIADLNHDGKLDLAVSNADEGTVSAFIGRGDGTFTHAGRHPMSILDDAVVIADFDADGHPDIATSAVGDDAPAVARGRGDGTFEKARSLDWIAYQGGAVADFNLDGRPDLAFAATDAPEANVFLNWTGLPAPPCVVLDVARDRLATAERRLRDGNCRLGHVARHPSRKVARRRVIAPRPRIGSVLPSGSRVDLVMSQGRRR